MKDTPTPRTDALRNKLHENINTPNIVKYMETVLHSNELETELKAVTQQRDEAREDAERWKSSSDAMERAGAEQARRADENREWALKTERELTAAREELAEWSILKGWGGTPEIINDFIKGQQTRIHHAQNIEEELTAVTEQRDEALSDLEFRRELYSLQTKQLDDVREQRDRLLEQQEQWRLSSVCRELTQQRDEARKLAERYRYLSCDSQEEADAEVLPWENNQPTEP